MSSNPSTPAPAPATAPAVQTRPPLVRHRDGRIVAGVSVGVADHLGVGVWPVRLFFIIATAFSGAGALAYGLLAATMPAASAGQSPRSATVQGKARGRSATSGTTRSVVIASVVALAVLGVLGVSSRSVDVGTILPLVAIAFGAVFFWGQLDEDRPSALRVRWVWLVGGLVLTIGGLIALLAQSTDRSRLWPIAGAVVAALVGLSVLAAPWILRLWSSLRTEQEARIRATERADIAAHLHDSVLQTLALIQRQAGDPAAVARLARAQERQLRTYLYDDQASSGTFAAAVTAALHEVEDLHGVPVDTVVTGDRPMDERVEALAKAIREATWNAVRHGAPPVSVYVEVGPSQVEAFVRDHGAGFDLDAVPADRAGVRESILGRMERAGGTARIRRRSDGTEVELVLPVTNPANPGTPGGSS